MCTVVADVRCADSAAEPPGANALAEAASPAATRQEARSMLEVCWVDVLRKEE